MTTTISSKSHHQNKISCIFLQSIHQIDMKNFVKCYKDFLQYFPTLKSYLDWLIRSEDLFEDLGKTSVFLAFLVLPMVTPLLLIWSDNKHKRRMHFVNCSRCSAVTATRLVYYRRTVHKKQFIDYWYNIFEMSFFYSMTWLHFFTNNFWKTSFLSWWRQKWDFWCQKISNEQKGWEPKKIVSTDPKSQCL